MGTWIDNKTFKPNEADLLLYLLSEPGQQLCINEAGEAWVVSQGTHWREGGPKVIIAIGELGDTSEFCEGWARWDEDERHYVTLDGARIIGDEAALVTECVREYAPEAFYEELAGKVRYALEDDERFAAAQAED